MTNFNQNPGLEQNQSNIDYLELDDLISPHRRASSDRSLLGIPAEGDHYQFRPPAQGVRYDRPTSVSQSSSWETLSATSHTPSFSMIDACHNENTIIGTQNPYDSPVYPYASLGEAPVGSAGNSTSLFGPWNQDHTIKGPDSSFIPSEPPQSDCQIPVSLAAGISNCDVYPSTSRLMIDTSLHEQWQIGESYNNCNQFPEFDNTKSFVDYMIPNSIDHPSDGLNDLDTSDDVEPTSASDAIESPPENGPFSLESSPRDQQSGTHLGIPTASRKRKRQRTKSTSPSTRPDLPKINGVRRKGACYPCRALNEAVCFALE